MKRLTYQFVKAYIESLELVLLSRTYKGNRAKLKILCKNNHIFYSCFNSIKDSNTRCPYCSGKKVDPKEARQYVESRGYKLLSPGYVNNKTKLHLVCPKGHDYKVRYGHFRYSERICPVCSKRDIPTIKHIKNYLQDFSYELLSKRYINNSTKLDLLCDRGHKCSISWNNFLFGTRCYQCSNHGFKKNKTASLYYLRITINDRFFYKIGITNRPVKLRLNQIPYPAKIIWQKQYLWGQFAYEDEQALLEKYEHLRYKGDDIYFGGYTELFVSDVLNKDTN